MPVHRKYAARRFTSCASSAERTPNSRSSRVRAQLRAATTRAAPAVGAAGAARSVACTSPQSLSVKIASPAAFTQR